MRFGGFAVSTRRNLFYFLALAAAVVFLWQPASAHHSTADYDMTKLGTVKG
jgi:hypothetical protein